jgi:hypothetical protein
LLATSGRGGDSTSGSSGNAATASSSSKRGSSEVPAYVARKLAAGEAQHTPEAAQKGPSGGKRGGDEAKDAATTTAEEVDSDAGKEARCYATRATQSAHAPAADLHPPGQEYVLLIFWPLRSSPRSFCSHGLAHFLTIPNIHRCSECGKGLGGPWLPAGEAAAAPGFGWANGNCACGECPDQWAACAVRNFHGGLQGGCCPKPHPATPPGLRGEAPSDRQRLVVRAGRQQAPSLPRLRRLRPGIRPPRRGCCTFGAS